MAKMDRQRWQANVKSMEIVAKPNEEITQEDIDFLRESYTSMGGLLPKGFNGGAFFTPTHVAKFIWQVITSKLPKNPRILEPSVGSGVLIEHAPEDSEITALELDETSARVTQLIYPKASVIQGDSILYDRPDYYDLAIGNPPFGESIAINESDGDFSDWITLKKTKGVYKGKSECVFIEKAIRNVKPGGYIAYVLPKGINFANYADKLRKYMHDTCWHVATIMLPCETFVHVGTTIETQLLILRKATPNARKIRAITTKWGSNFRRGGYEDISDFQAEFLEGQTPAYFAKVTDIGWDAKGRSTDKWGEGLTQLDELVNDLTDSLVRENLYPHIPSWHSIKDVSAFFFSHGNDTCDGFRDASSTYSDGPYRWNELTLGSGEEVEWNRELVSTFDFDWQDRIVAEYYAGLTKSNEKERIV